MINFLKVAAIRTADWVNAHHDPFQDFTRPARPKYAETLRAKAQRFEDDFTQNFWMQHENIFTYNRPLVGTMATGDQALWHGVAAAMWALKWAVTKDPVAHNWLSACVDGLAAQQPDGVLARGLDLGAYTWDASNDQATGHLAGLYFAIKYGLPGTSAKAVALLDRWAGNVLGHGDALVNQDGTPTSFGKLVQGPLTDPLRLSLCGAIYHNAFVATGARQYRAACERLVRGYGELIEYPKVRLLWYDTVYDTHRAALHLVMLPGSARSLDRMRGLVTKQGNIWVNGLCAYAHTPSPDDRVLALKVLSEFTLEDKQFNGFRINSDNPDVDKTLWNGEWVSRQPLPRWMVAAQDFFWQRSLYTIDYGTRGDQANMRYNGLDYLAAYWLMRLNNVITEAD